MHTILKIHESSSTLASKLHNTIAQLRGGNNNKAVAGTSSPKIKTKSLIMPPPRSRNNRRAAARKREKRRRTRAFYDAIVNPPPLRPLTVNPLTWLHGGALGFPEQRFYIYARERIYTYVNERFDLLLLRCTVFAVGREKFRRLTCADWVAVYVRKVFTRTFTDVAEVVVVVQGCIWTCLLHVRVFFFFFVESTKSFNVYS